MPRKPRKDYRGAVHHVFTRGVARTAVARDDHDFRHALVLLEKAVSRYELVCHAWCFMPNHSHLLVTSQLKNISPAMQWLGARTAESFNRRYERSGHLYQGRFGSRLVEDDGYLLELARYLPLNPVKAGLCESPGDWAWSSYSATAGVVSVPAFLETRAFLGALGSADAYVSWVADGVLGCSLDEHGFVRPEPRPSLASLLETDCDQAIAAAHFRHGYTQVAIAKHLGVSRAQIWRRLA
jgi:REP element-mobilizing transposase RayT